MNQAVVKKINHLQSEKASWKVALFSAKNEDDKEEVEAIEKEIAGIDNEISKYAVYLNDDNYVVEEDEVVEESSEEE